MGECNAAGRHCGGCLRRASVLPCGLPAQQAALAVEPPFLCRFLSPWTLAQFLPTAWMDTLALLLIGAGALVWLPLLATLPG